MTYGIKNIVGGLALLKKKALPKGFLGTENPLYGAEWSKVRLCGGFIEKDTDWTLGDIETYLWGAHLGHALDFSVALFNYFLFYADGSLFEEAKEVHIGWVSRLFFFNLCCCGVIPNFWHIWSYCTPIYRAYKEGGMKLSETNQYEPDTDEAGMFFSSTGNLEREITFTTLGWLQSAFWQCLFTHLWACGYLYLYVDFWAYPVYSVTVFWLISYWREIHFFFAHRGMHPWWDRKNTLMDGDIGAFLYRHVHSLHHKSYNPGPWSGLCMHPVEHFLYYTCCTLPPLFLSVHPIHFLYCKFHADIAPIGGHDGMDSPGGKGDFHWLHHAKFECNYGVPFPVNLDLLFGTWADVDVFLKTGELTCGAWAKSQMHDASEEESEEHQATGESTTPLIDAESKSTKEIVIKEYDMDEVAEHRSVKDCWLALYGKVFDVTKFLDAHPGGKGILLSMAGKDATSEFENIHSSSGGFSLVNKWMPNCEVGIVRNYDGPAPPEESPSTAIGSKWPGVFLFIPVFILFAYLVYQTECRPPRLCTTW